MAHITRVLFIGNSFTARNDLPGLLAQLVRGGGKGELECELISGGGASLRMHLNKGEAHERMQASRWDYVVSNLAGSYLAACTFYATLFSGQSKSIPNLDLGLAAKTVAVLHEAALAIAA